MWVRNAGQGWRVRSRLHHTGQAINHPVRAPPYLLWLLRTDSQTEPEGLWFLETQPEHHFNMSVQATPGRVSSGTSVGTEGRSPTHAQRREIRGGYGKDRHGGGKPWLLRSTSGMLRCYMFAEQHPRKTKPKAGLAHGHSFQVLHDTTDKCVSCSIYYSTTPFTFLRTQLTHQSADESEQVS